MATWSELFSTLPELQSTSSAAPSTPLQVVSRRTVGAGFLNLIDQRLAAAFRGLSSRVERVTVRFEDLNGPKGGIDTACRIQLRMSGQPPLVVEGRAEDEGRAFRVALPRLIAALDRQLNRRAVRRRTTVRRSAFPHAV